MKELFKSILHKLLAEYSIYWIYRCEQKDLPVDMAGTQSVHTLTPEDEQTLPEAAIRDQSGFLGEEANAFVFREQEHVTAICIFWHGQRYARRNFWPLKAGEAKLVQIITDPMFRGKGAATGLIQQSSERMLASGFRALYARVWHSNTPSLRAFERAGWKRIALAIELKRTPRSKGMKIVIPTWRSSRK